MSEKQLIWKNTVATIKREQIYFYSMSIIVTLMFSFHAMIFSEDVQAICEQSIILNMLLGLVTIFIVIVNIWFIHYMMKNALKTRSTEFGLYLLFGKTQKEVARLFQRETICLARLAFFIGFLLSLCFQQFLMIVFYHMFRLEYEISMDFHIETVILTYLIYFSCYRFALFKIKKSFLKMTIYATNQMKEEQEYKVEKDTKKRNQLSLFLLKGNRLFLWKNIVSQIKTMKRMFLFVSILLFISIVGSSIAMMYTDYQNKQIDIEFPFDLMIYHKNIREGFEEEKKLLKKEVGISEYKEYFIYQNGTDTMRNWLYTHLDYFGDTLQSEDETVDEEQLEQEEDYQVYYSYDTFMKYSDYKDICAMLGKQAEKIGNDEYILQVKDRILPELSENIKNRTIVVGKHKLRCGVVSTIPFGQNGHNGADYLYIVPDHQIKEMKPYYRVMVANTKYCVDSRITEQIEDLGKDTFNFYYGSNHSILYTSPILAKKEIEITLKSMLTALLFPFAYVSFVFLCIALAILSIHIVSCLKKNKKRYDILKKLGMTKKEIGTLIDKELVIEFMIPLAIGLFFGSIVAYQMGHHFTISTGLKTASFQYVFVSLLWILVVYFFYFLLCRKVIVSVINE